MNRIKNIKFINFIFMLIMTLALLVSTAGSVFAESVSLHTTGTLYRYGGGGSTYYKYVTWNGKNYDAYCIEPTKAAPSSKKYKVNNMTDSGGTWGKLAKVAYFAKGAPGESQLKSWMKKNGLSGYTSGGAFYSIMHIALSYAYNGSGGFKIYGGGTLSKDYQNKVKKVVNYCYNHYPNTVKNPDFTVKSGSNNVSTAVFDASKGVYTTAGDKFKVDCKDTEQYFTYKVRNNMTLYYLKKGESGKGHAVAAGKTVTLKHGYTFWFEISPKVTSGFKETANGALFTLDALLMQIGGKQNIVFCPKTSKESASTTFKVNLTPQYGKFKVVKYQQKLSGAKVKEPKVTFQIYNTMYSSYAAASKSDLQKLGMNVCDEKTTDANGAFTTRDLFAGTYIIHQKTSVPGYKNAPDKQVTISADKVVSVERINEEIGFKVKVVKVDEETGERIPLTADFGLYSKATCLDADKLSTITTSASTGEGWSGKLTEGTYYVKETRAPSGTVNGETKVYDLNPNVFTVKLKYSANAYNTATAVYEYVLDPIGDTLSSTHPLAVMKLVTGTDASESFDYTIELSGLKANASYQYRKVSGLSSSVTDVNSITGGTEGILRADSSGNGTLNISLTRNEAFKFDSLPTSAKYKITEHEKTGYKPSYKIVQGIKAGYVERDSASVGRPISIEGELINYDKANESDRNYGVFYHLTNTKEDSHDIKISKEVKGEFANPQSTFTFNVSFNNLKADGSQYIKPGYVIVDESGKKAVTIDSRAEELINSSTYVFNIQLKHKQYVKFFSIYPNTTYNITEMSSDYIPSYTESSNGGYSDDTGLTGVANESLSLASTRTVPAGNQEFDYGFINDMPRPDSAARATVTKQMDEDTGEVFNFTFEGRNLTPGGHYNLYKLSEEGVSVNVSANASEITVTDSEGNPLPGIAVVVFRKGVAPEGTLVANDTYGAHKTRRTDANGKLQFTEFNMNWLNQHGQGADIYVLGELVGEYAAGSTSVSYNGTEKYEFHPFVADDSGRVTAEGESTVSVDLGVAQFAYVDGLDIGARYTWTESGSRYLPTYEVVKYYGDGSMTKEVRAGSGSVGQNCKTALIAIEDYVSYMDDVTTFTNSKDTSYLRVEKESSKENDTTLFNYKVNLSGLSSDFDYFAMVKGEHTLSLTMNADGDLTVYMDGTVYEEDNIPIRIVKSEGVAKTVYTTNGVALGETYADWLLSGQTFPFDFTVEFFGKDVTATVTE